MLLFKTYLDHDALGIAQDLPPRETWDILNEKTHEIYFREPTMAAKLARNTPAHAYLRKFMGREGLVFDAGCSAHKLATLFDSTRRTVVGLDFSFKTLQKARQIHPEGHAIACDLFHLPFADNSLNELVYFSALEHDEDGPTALLKEAFRVLQPRGRLIALFATPNLTDHVLFRLFYWLGRRKMQYGAVPLKVKLVSSMKRQKRPQFYAYFFSRSQAQSLLLRAGFIVRHRHRLGFLPALMRSRIFGERATQFVQERQRRLLRGENPSPWRGFWDDLLLREDVYESGEATLCRKLMTFFYRSFYAFVCEKPFND